MGAKRPEKLFPTHSSCPAVRAQLLDAPTSLQEELTILSLRVSSLKTHCPGTSGQSHATPDTGWLWGAGPPQLCYSIWGACLHHPMTMRRRLFHGSARGRGEAGFMALRRLPGFVSLLAESPCSHCRARDAAVNLHHQQLQTSRFKSKQEDPTLSVGSVLT